MCYLSKAGIKWLLLFATKECYSNILSSQQQLPAQNISCFKELSWSLLPNIQRSLGSAWFQASPSSLPSTCPGEGIPPTSDWPHPFPHRLMQVWGLSWTPLSPFSGDGHPPVLCIQPCTHPLSREAMGSRLGLGLYYCGIGRGYVIKEQRPP